MSYQFNPTSRLTVFGDYVDTNIRNNDDNLPRIPPGRLGVRYELDAGPLSGDLEYVHTFAQNKLALYETRTAGYGLLNATLAYRFDMGPAKGVECAINSEMRGAVAVLPPPSFVHPPLCLEASARRHCRSGAALL